MKRTLLVLGIGLLFTGTALAQNAAPANPYQSLADRLNAMVTVPLDSWKFHPDIPHPEAAAVDDNDWPTVKTGEDWKTGPRVLRKLIEIPATVNGYKTQGARIRLQLSVDSRDFVTITVFSNGSMVSRTDGDTLQPIVLTENAQPGEKFLIAIRFQAAQVNTQIRTSQLQITPACQAAPIPEFFGKRFWPCCPS